jgi:hypothetical protein
MVDIVDQSGGEDGRDDPSGQMFSEVSRDLVLELQVFLGDLLNHI